MDSSDITTLMNQSSVAKEKVMRSTYGIADDVVAVFKVGSCGSYKELWLKMDCEDRRTTSYTSGQVGDTYVDGDGNVNFHFCLTEANRYYPGGVLLVKHRSYNVGSTNPDHIYVRHHDTEDSDSYNDFFSTHSSFDTDVELSTGFTKISRSDLVLAWDFPMGYDFLGTPIGPSYIKYGLLVMSHAATGEILCDDEDKNNKNWGQLWEGHNYKRDVDGDIFNSGMILNENTTYRVAVSTDSDKFITANFYYPKRILP
ncbi:MAG: hypothetical protein RR706_10030 [Muribaculaceae bacterium]